ncbi:hypothetical protein AVEN_163203-1 [Araneus ventricosus]|uniref:TIL domain-containing protein n=1 Tax=Araneus ventricosus TaxID=182803 RepID=A0A4Y2I8I0_ARAVE|nr:hypothetical protein AVEN_163203-1 [Araneus ventricosus]
MKAVLFLCSVTLLVSLIAAQDDSDSDQADVDSFKRFIEKIGGNTDCKGNTVFGRYKQCDTRCDQQLGPNQGCVGGSTIACGACPKGLIPVDESRTQCVKPEDCP